MAQIPRRARWTRHTPPFLPTLLPALMLAGCLGGPTPSPTLFPTPSVPPLTLRPLPSDWVDTFVDAYRAGILDDVATAPTPAPFLGFDTDTRSVLPLQTTEQIQFCNMLGTPAAEHGLASLVGLIIEGIYGKVTHRPPPDELDHVLGIAATFVTTSCPAWNREWATTP